MEIRPATDEGFLAEIRERLAKSVASDELERPQVASGGALSLSELDACLRFSQQVAGAIGEIPPGPPTWRARVGRALIRVVQRMLFWYTPQIYAFNNLVVRTTTEQLRVFSQVSEALARLKAENAALREQVAEWRSTAERERDAARDAEAVWRDQLETESRRREALSRAVREQQVQTQTQFGARLEALRTEFTTVAGRAADSVEAKYRPRIETMERMLSQARAELAGQSRRIPVMLAEIPKRAPESVDTQQVQNLVSEEQHKMDALYVGFEDCFRGTREDIKDRLRVYLPRLHEAGIGRNGMPVLDVGCGRGEWLGLLREEGLEARGLDLNRVMVAECRASELDAVEADLLPYLRSLPDTSLGALTGFHIIEHLPFSALIDLLDETVRLLKPGGMAIFETPNPANLLVASHTFYYDPTHRNPLPSTTMAFLAAACGLCRIEILPLHPAAEGLHFKENGSELVTRLNQYFWGPQDYAIVGRKA